MALTKAQKEERAKAKEKQAQAGEAQIVQQQRIADYTIREYPVEVLVSKYREGQDDNTSEIYIPEYQREFVWKSTQQSRFIESVLIGLPIPYIFSADSTDEEREGCLEIIDGSQRLRTLDAFLQNALKLTKLEKLSELNGCKFHDLLPSRQRRLRRTTIRMIEMTSNADEETRLDMFDRLNTGGTHLTFMETLRGSRQGALMDLVAECAKDDLFKRLCPVSDARAKRYEHEELVLRFFAYADRYSEFVHRVDEFLRGYVDDNISATTEQIESLRSQFNRTMEFVSNHFPNGFKKHGTNFSVPRIRYEALAVGVELALRETPNLAPGNVDDWLESEEFKFLTRSDASNNKDRVMARFEFVKKILQGESIEALSKEYNLIPDEQKED